MMLCLIFSGDDVVDNIFTVLLSTGMFLGGVIGFILDNTIPGDSKLLHIL